MSRPKDWIRRGQWLELVPGKKIAGSSDREAEAENWLVNELGLPEKLLRKLQADKGIEWRGDRLRLALFPVRSAGIDPVWYELNVLYEDDFCLVVHKPAGMNIHPDGRNGEITLDHAVAAHYESQGEEIAVRHVHRLDLYTSGPVLYAKNEWAQLRLDEAMREKQIDRKYVAFAEGRIPSELTIFEQPIGKDRHHNQRRRVSSAGQAAVTHIIDREIYKHASMVRLKLETGRTHQIRVHLSHAGYPLLGDTLYGGYDALISRQALHGEQLSFEHPFTGETIEVMDPWPEDMIELKQLLDS